MQRLEVLNRSNDGFYIANEDLKLRGPGDFFGVRQSGMMDFILADEAQLTLPEIFSTEDLPCSCFMSS